MDFFKFEPWEWWVMGGLLITYYLIKRIRKKRRLNRERLEADANSDGQNGMADQEASSNPGCLMAIANLFIRPWANRMARQIDNDPEIIEATKKAHESLAHLRVTVDELMKKREQESEQKLMKQMEWFQATYIDSGVLEASGQKSNKRDVATKATNPAISHPKLNLSKDRTIYYFEKLSYGKSRLVNAVVRSYVFKNPGTTYDALKKAFPDELQGSFGVFTLKEKASQIFKEKGVARHYLQKNELILLKDSVIATSTEWRKDNIQDFIARAKALNINIETT